MELTPGAVVLFVVVAVAVGFVLIRWGRRHEAAAPTDAPHAPAPGKTMAAREARASQPLVGWLLDRALEQTGIRVADDPLARDRISQAAAKVMEELRTDGSVSISLPFLVADARGPRHFDVTFKRNPDGTFELQG